MTSRLKTALLLSRVLIAVVRPVVRIAALPGEILRALDPAESWRDR